MVDKIYRPKFLTESEKEQFFAGLDSYLRNKWQREQEQEAERKAQTAAKIASGEYVVKDGKLYDARFFKG